MVGIIQIVNGPHIMCPSDDRSMGNDSALACLSKKPKLAYDYLKQMFAQVRLFEMPSHSLFHCVCAFWCE